MRRYVRALDGILWALQVSTFDSFRARPRKIAQHRLYETVSIQGMNCNLGKAKYSEDSKTH